MTVRDVEVLELLADRPELLAVADAVAATQRDLARPPHRRLAVRLTLVGVAAALLAPSAWAIQRALRSAHKPPRTPAMVAAAHRDEKTMLRLFVAPPRARRSGNEPAVFAHAASIFGLTPSPYARFTRVAYWRVSAPVSAVLAFERAHRPSGSTLSGCPANFVPSKDTGCGVGRATGHGVPPNASLFFTFPRIHGLVSSRELRVDMIGSARRATAIRLVATNQTWIPYRFRNHGSLPILLRFVPGKGFAAIAGRTFTGVYVYLPDPRRNHLKRIVCGGTLDGQPLPGRARIVSASKALKAVGPVEELTCSWKLPVDAAGKRLRVGTGTGDGARVAAYTARSAHAAAATISSPEYSWIVRK